MAKGKMHMELAVSVSGSRVPACGAYGWRTTLRWPNVTCKRCLNNRASIDTRNAKRIAWFEGLLEKRKIAGGE